MSVSMRTADRVTAVVLGALGAAMLVGGYTMDRLEIRDIHPSSIPGLVPMILGGLLMACAGLLYRSAGAGPGGEAPFMSQGSFKRLGVTAVLGVVYALGLVGTLPFSVATAIFVMAFTLIFSWPDAADARRRVVTVVAAVVFGIVVAASVSLLFRYGFLVRLP